jgi:hypothetical protein
LVVRKEETDLNGVKGTSSGLGVELNTPDLLARLGSRDDALNGRVVGL